MSAGKLIVCVLSVLVVAVVSYRIGRMEAEQMFPTEEEEEETEECDDYWKNFWGDDTEDDWDND